MTFDEMQRAMEFIVQQQARTETNLARLEANLNRERDQRAYHEEQLQQNLSRLEAKFDHL